LTEIHDLVEAVLDDILKVGCGPRQHNVVPDPQSQVPIAAFLGQPARQAEARKPLNTQERHARMRIELIDDVRSAWRMFSVQAMSAALAVQGAWAALSDDLKTSIPHWVVTGLTLALLVTGIGGRLVRQSDTQTRTGAP
jgi:hypothetical protein